MTTTLSRRSFIVLSAGACVSGIGLVSACSAGSSSGTKNGGASGGVMKISTSSPATNSLAMGATAFASNLKKRTNGELTARIYPNSTLASPADTLTGMKLGTIEGGLIDAGNAESTAPELGILDLPYLFDSQDHWSKVMNGSVGQNLAQSLDAKGIHILAWWSAGFHDVFNNGHAIESPSDMRGLKIRTVSSPAIVETFKALGAVPTPLDPSDVYLGLQTGTIKGAESTLSSAWQAKWVQLCKFISVTHHLQATTFFACSSKWWNALSSDVQNAVQGAATDASPAVLDAPTHDLNATLDQARQAGITVVTPDQAAFRGIVQTTVWPKYYGQFGEATIDAIRQQA